MIASRSTLRLLALGGALVVLAPASALAAASRSFTGRCQFTGPIHPSPPITVVPRPGAHFSYRGHGTCSGALGARSVSATPIVVSFRHASTLFDTCELGPDVDLAGVATIGAGRRRALFRITIYLARIALAGPFLLRTPGGGEATGTAQFTPPKQSTAPQQCAQGGIGIASLSASFSTQHALLGTADPAPARRVRRR